MPQRRTGDGRGAELSAAPFDWSSLNLTKKIAPELPLVALSSGDAWLEVGRPGASPNLGGIDIDTYGGSLAQAAAAQGYNAISPAFRSVTPGMITEAHGLGLPVIPWTVNTTADINRLMDLGVDGIISDYPTRLRTVMEERGMKLPKAYPLVASRGRPRQQRGRLSVIGAKFEGSRHFASVTFVR
ncbi:glycerophosphoryl diester phosphodiesterase [Arthrobacter sp. UYCu512]|uniref:glycerophosphodiester phosphodiesterase family protein n=1 Tax=Arthrobacter sp. UYCu512 TaxID=3156338 RepID=UPI0033926CD3